MPRSEAPPFRWENTSSGVIHGGYLLSMESTCGMRVGEVVSNWRLIDPDAEITCLNCKNVLMPDSEREQRREFRRWFHGVEQPATRLTHAERLDRAVNG